jgi:hypothetical protein
MKDIPHSLKRLAQERLKDLGCDQLPNPVMALVVDGYCAKAQSRLKRLAKREITIPKIAVLLKQAFTTEKGSRGKTEGFALGDAGFANEVSQNP